MSRIMHRIGFVAVALALSAMPAAAAEKATVIKKQATTKLQATGTTGTTGTVGTTGPVELSTSDCKLLLNGTVIAVSDGRCGASGKYCKSSAGSACITE